MSTFIPEEDRVPEPEPQQSSKPGAQFVRAVLERVPWGDSPWMYATRPGVSPSGTAEMALAESYSTTAVVQDVLSALYGLGVLDGPVTTRPQNALAAAQPEETDIEEVARYLADLSDHPRFAEPPKGLGYKSLIGQEGNVLMAARNAMARSGNTANAEIMAARDILVRHARKMAEEAEKHV